MERVSRTAVRTVYTLVDDCDWLGYSACAECGSGPDDLIDAEIAIDQRPSEIVVTYVWPMYVDGCEQYCAHCAKEMERES